MASILHQRLFPQHLANVPNHITVRQLTLHTSGMLATHVLDNDTAVLGISLRLSSDGTIDTVAFATPHVVFYLSAGGTQAALGKARAALERVLDGTHCVVAGFGMARIALHLHRHFGVDVQGADLSTLHALSTRKPQSPAEFASLRICADVSGHQIHALWYNDNEEDVCLRAWLSAVLAEDSSYEIECAAKVHTQNLQDMELRCLSELVANVEQLEIDRPTNMNNEFEHVGMGPDGQVVVQNARFNNRVRASKQTHIVLETAHGHITGHAVRAEGKTTDIKVVGGNFRGSVKRIQVIGREEPTNAELARDEFILLLLRGDIGPLVNLSPYIRLLWFPSKVAPKRSARAWGGMTDSEFRGAAYRTLNASQKEVVHAMWSGEEPLVVAHGPPGTGKTTTIATVLEGWDWDREPTWVVAQSNVGVKNIARTLIKYAVDFKLIVSKEFYVEWHEHLYESIEERLIRSDDLFSDPVSTERRLGGSKIVLSTISMLSNPALDNCGVFYVAPVERLVVDEASQIDSFELMHLFHKFDRLEKVCMFGDPKQLPPYGQETAPKMKTIFDFRHLKPSAYFLNTQYRMPVLLGQFISEEVYNSKLKSVHKIGDWSCVSFVDVRKGQEQSADSSWRNVEEVYTVVNIVKHYYRSVDLCVITPYDAQRAAIASRLKAENLPWECVYNVDSFQGHEAAYVIVSTVRTAGAGFLKSLNRMNVMLTRCKAGMVLVTNRNFLLTAGRDTLLGKLAQRWNRGVHGNIWIDPRELTDRSASLPGVQGRAASVYASLPVQTFPPEEQTTGNSEPARVVPGAWPGAVTSLINQSRAGHAASRGVYRTHVTTARPSMFSDAAYTSGGPRLNMFKSQPAPGSVDAPSPQASTYAPSPSSPPLRAAVNAWRPSSSASLNSHFPTLDCLGPPKQPQVKGRWRAGSDACKL